jgi:hypothetical protein
MSSGALTLEEIQRAMASAVMMPLTPSEDMRERAPDGRPMEAVAASFIAPNSRLSAFERLEIYNRQYWYRMLGALREDFPALRAILGSRRFEALSIAYLAEYPSRSFTLRNLGSNLVGWLDHHREYTGRRHRLAVDVARVEWAFVEAFDAAEREPLTLEEIATLDASSRLALQPHMQLLALNCAADDIVVSLHTGAERQTSEAGVADEEPELPPADVPPIRRRLIWVAAHRVDLSIYYRRLAREEYLTLCAMKTGAPLGEALAAGLSHSRASASRQAVLVQQWFGTWAELGWLCAPDLESAVRT